MSPADLKIAYEPLLPPKLASSCKPPQSKRPSTLAGSYVGHAEDYYVNTLVKESPAKLLSSS